jgi:hypothetical protein
MPYAAAVSVLDKIKGWFKPAPVDPAAQAEAERLRDEQETVRTSQLGPSGGGNLPPTRDVTDPRN